ncbi:hypothetical protein TSAR_016832 [Trichomalopsis sarcophagae]|uniref:Uncharacterized protein n=1 Tax=Trichomalopsis sarcophagae TaxID=543379 RepID=A0A232EKK1_9HYME|nr:hypothetical protein TSAR_016832 [Trichomalopsis sarcophagae]
MTVGGAQALFHFSHSNMRSESRYSGGPPMLKLPDFSVFKRLKCQGANASQTLSPWLTTGPGKVNDCNNSRLLS